MGVCLNFPVYLRVAIPVTAEIRKGASSALHHESKGNMPNGNFIINPKRASTILWAEYRLVQVQ